VTAAIPGGLDVSAALGPAASILAAIGNTPLVELRRIVPAGHARVLLKLESCNPTGSYKDRMALAMIEEAERRGTLREGMTVVEYTGGSTGSSLAMVCAAKGYRFQVVSSNAYAPAKLETMRAFGAQLELVDSPSGTITPDLVPRMMARARELALAPGMYPTDQFNNADSLLGYRRIGEELLGQLPQPPDAFCGAVGTGGMLMGVAQALQSARAATRIVALEPAATPVLSGGVAGSHRVEGVGVGFVPPLFERSRVHSVLAIDEARARDMCRRLAREEGIFAGTSSGLNVVGALALAGELGAGCTVVTVACDSGLKYVGGDLFGG
jgi:cysteine synthase